MTKPNGCDWTVGIQHPREPDAYVALAALRGRSLATSGDYESTFSADFAKHHIFDPHTGKSPRELASVEEDVDHRDMARARANGLKLSVFGVAWDRRLRRCVACFG